MLEQLQTIAEGARVIRDFLKTEAEKETWGGAKVSAMKNLNALWQAVQNMAGTNHPQVLICYNGEIPVGGVPRQKSISHRVERNWLVVIIAPHSVAGEPLLEENPKADQADRTFYDFVELVRDGCRSILTISDELFVEYVGIRPLATPYPGIPSVFLNAYAVEFKTANDIPQVQIP